MFEKIDEKIDVLVKFSSPKQDKADKKNNSANSFGVSPLYIRWREKLYKIEKVNLIHREGKGDDKVYYFSVSDNANFFRLAFYTGDMSWRLEELYNEG